MPQKIDLFLGSEIGAWALTVVSPSQVGRVVTLQKDIASAARRLGIPVQLGNANHRLRPRAPLAVSVHYPRIFGTETISSYRRMYNLHPGFLPWGRGYYPVFWALWEQTPAGATMHEISPGVDEGPIVAQSRIEITEDDTGGTLHARVVQAEKRLFRRFWPQFVSGEIPPAVPQVGTGTYHTRREFFDLKRNAHWRSMSTQDMIRLIRAYTFPGCKGLEVHLGRQAFTLTLEQSRAAMAKDCRSRGH